MHWQQACDQAWNKAQPRLASIQDSIVSSISPDPRTIRVGQLDSELLDQGLALLLQEPLNKALALISSSLKARFDPELALLVQLTLYKLSIWNTGASYGAKLQDLRYVVPLSDNYSSTPSGLPRRTLLVHGTLTMILPYVHNRLRTYALSHAWPDAPSNDRRRRAWDVLIKIESAYMACGLASFVTFLWDGRYRTIIERFLRMTLVPSRRLVKRDVSYEFMNRQMVWHAFTEFLLFLLPLLSTSPIRRRLTSHLNWSTNLISVVQSVLGFPNTSTKGQTSETLKRGKYYLLPKDQCAICTENSYFSLDMSEPVNAFTSLTIPPTFSRDPSTSMSGNLTPPDPEPASEPPAHPLNTPYITSCGHIYCYHCIAERMMRVTDEVDGGIWECLRCGEDVKHAERWIGDISEEDGSEWDGLSSNLSEFEGGTNSSISSSLGYSISEYGTD